MLPEGVESAFPGEHSEHGIFVIDVLFWTDACYIAYHYNKILESFREAMYEVSNKHTKCKKSGYLPKQGCFYIHLHNKSLASGISFCKNPPINNMFNVNELNALITDTDWLWIKNNNLQNIDYMRLTLGQRYTKT